MIWRTLAACGAAGVVLLFAGGCGSAPAGAEQAKKGGPPGAAAKGPMQRRPYNVRTAYVTTQPLTYEVRAVGNIAATDIYRIDSRVPGTIYDVKFNEGDTVKTDDVLCRIAPEAYRFKAQKQEGLYKEAQANLVNAKRRLGNEVERKRIDLSRASLEVARRREVKEAGAISDEEIQLFQSRRDLAEVELKDAREAAETELKALEAKVMETEADFKIAEDDVRKSIVRSPIAGVIEKRSVTNGMFVQSGTALAMVVDRSVLKLRFKVSESESAIIKAGEKVQFTVPAHPGRTFEAEVYYVGSKMEDDARVVMVHSNVTKDAEILKPGYFASVSFVSRRNEKAIVVPLLATLPTERGFVAFVVKNGKAERRQIKTGIATTERDIEIVEGLKEGELLVVDGANALQDGSPVKVVEGPGAEPEKAKEVSAQQSK